MKIASAAIVGALLLSGLVAGCSDTDEEFRQECADLGGTVESEREKKSRTRTVDGKRKKETYYETDLDCVDDDGNEILDD